MPMMTLASSLQQLQDGQALCSGPCIPRQKLDRALYHGHVIGGKLPHLLCYIFSAFSAMPE
jgi:hypothetical protein